MEKMWLSCDLQSQFQLDPALLEEVKASPNMVQMMLLQQYICHQQMLALLEILHAQRWPSDQRQALPEQGCQQNRQGAKSGPKKSRISCMIDVSSFQNATVQNDGQKSEAPSQSKTEGLALDNEGCGNSPPSQSVRPARQRKITKLKLKDRKAKGAKAKPFIRPCAQFHRQHTPSLCVFDRGLKQLPQVDSFLAKRGVRAWVSGEQVQSDLRRMRARLASNIEQPL